MEQTVLAFPAEAGPHLLTQEEQKAELPAMAGNPPRLFRHPQMVTHPITNQA